jgi:hypothetical protein
MSDMTLEQQRKFIAEKVMKWEWDERHLYWECDINTPGCTLVDDELKPVMFEWRWTPDEDLDQLIYVEDKFRSITRPSKKGRLRSMCDYLDGKI